jgi:hypothetical protein
MARVRESLLLNQASGRIGNVILKNYSYGTVISKRPDRSKVKLSKRQKAANELFKKAVKYAQAGLKNPRQYKQFARDLAKGKSFYHVALSHYLKTHRSVK